MRVWIGCLSCYNAGNLVGTWYDAAEAADVTSNEIHFGPGWRFAEDAPEHPHEELWVMDLDEAPIGFGHEMSPSDATEVALAVEAVEGRLSDYVGADVYFQWLLASYGRVEIDEITDYLERFEDLYVGKWDSFEDYAIEISDELLRGHGVSYGDLLSTYFDYEKFASDLRYDYDVLRDRSGSGVHVLHNN